MLPQQCPRIQGLEEEFGVELGSTLLRDVFNLARKHRPCIILLHNFDALSATSKFAAYVCR
jgi:ATP-dependent 26S proteasome regulatory subunit